MKKTLLLLAAGWLAACDSRPPVSLVDALAWLHQNYLKCGLTKRDDLVKMRKKVPDWEFRLVRW